MKRLIYGRRWRSWHLWLFRRLAALAILLLGGCICHRPAPPIPPAPAEAEHEWQTIDRIIGRFTDPWKAEDDR
jgi:hypothetical protein